MWTDYCGYLWFHESKNSQVNIPAVMDSIVICYSLCLWMDY